jgi:hypothetical protein
MPGDWKGPYRRRLQKRASERGRRMANARWAKFHADRSRLDVLDPVRVGGRIIERLVRVTAESRVIERTFYEFDRPCDWRRKRNEIFAFK